VYILDTDHISLLHRFGDEGRRIQARLATVAPEEAAVSIVSCEEQMRGWLAEIARLRGVDKQRDGYSRLERLLQYYCATPLLPFNDAAVAHFQNLWLLRLRVGTMDLKIAAIALANDATLLTRNTSDFSKVPGLRVEDWSA
jgi:tRNA(fMet)-specific endonuclease VapC